MPRTPRVARHNFGGWRDVHFPRLLLASPAVLIETYAEGQPVTKFTVAGGRQALSAAQRHFIVRRGLEIYLKMLLLDNLMYAQRELPPPRTLTPAQLAAADPICGFTVSVTVGVIVSIAISVTVDIPACSRGPVAGLQEDAASHTSGVRRRLRASLHT